MRLHSRALFVVLLAMAAGCPSKATTPQDAAPPARDATPTSSDAAPVALEAKLELAAVAFSDLEGWADDKHIEAIGAFRRSCRALVKKPADKQVGLYPIAGTTSDWMPACAAARKVGGADQARGFFETHFKPYRVSNRGERVGRFTGYYNARVSASRKKNGAYVHPIWGRPSDLVSASLSKFNPKLRGERIWGKLSGTRLVPYDTRKEIYAGSVQGRADVLFWANDPIDVFFAQVQGSAIVELSDGNRTRIGVGGKNGRIYTAIGRVLIAEGELTRETVSMQSIRKWMLDHPKEAMPLMEKNEAYIFFREVKGDGPYGAQGVVLTPGRSLAVDLRWIPMTAPLWVVTEVPTIGTDGHEAFRRLLIAQDTGGAIRSPVRGDIYFGDDANAFDQAGRMKGVGTYHILLPKALDVENGGSQEPN